tara:strand:+ start:74 stop:307 length:234 start_codon:yes stop_codon:yes gene_type:complete
MSSKYSDYGAFIINANGKESAHVHRTTSYIANLKNNWAYKNKSNIPKLKNSAPVYHNSDFKEIMNKLEARFANTSST